MKSNAFRSELRRLARWQLIHRLAVAFYRSLWLPVAVLAGSLVAALLGRPVSWDVVAVAGVLLALLNLAAAFWRRPSPQRLARALDRRLGLHEQLATAYEVSQQGRADGPIQGHLVAQAGATLRRLRRHPILDFRFPLRELETFFALALVTGGLWFLGDAGTGMPAVARRHLPPPVPEPILQRPGEEQPPAPPPATQPALAQLGEALQQNPLTRRAGEALEAGDAGAAGAALRELADQVGELSPEERGALAQALRDAAQALGQELPELREALEQAATALERGSETQAAEALENLAREVEEAAAAGQESAAASGEEGQPGESGQGEPGAGQGEPAPGGQGSEGAQGSQAPGSQGGGGAGQGDGGQSQASAPPEELGVEGVPLELDPSEEGPPTDQAAEGDEATGATQDTERGFTRGGAPDTTVVQTGADPQRYPWELRETVRDYFQPTP